jgi:hypothetical protein
VTSGNGRSRGDAGFALIVALLALILLTFLGLTLATTTSTELQISTNYRWSQQALYNAEAGLEVARVVLSQVGDGQLVLPAARLVTWDPTTVPNPVPPSNKPTATQSAARNFEASACDVWGNGAGYGQVLVDPAAPGAPFQNVSTAFGQRLAGNFTVWVRREIVFNPDGTMADSPLGENVVVTAEGAAPFMDGATQFMRANQAIRRIESRVTVREGCRPSGPQASDSGFSSCEGL